MTWSAVTGAPDGSWTQEASASKTWSAATSGANESWSNTTSGSNESWSATGSNTTTRNTSRFILLNDGPDSSVSLIPHFREQEAGGRGIPFYMTEADPIALSDTSSGV